MSSTTQRSPSPEPRGSGLLGSSAIMAAGTVVSRLTGFARAAVIAAAIGLTAATADVFNVPNVIPNMIYILVGGGVLNSVLVPVLVRAIKTDADGGEAFSQRLFSLVVSLLATTTVLAILAAPWIIQLIVDERYLEPANRPLFDNMVMFAQLCLPQIFFYGLYVLLGQMLNAKGRFGPMMWSPILNNIVAIAIFGMFMVIYGQKENEPFTTAETLLLGVGSTVGVLAQALVLIPVLRRTGFTLRFRTDWRGQGLGESVRLGLWTFGFVMVNQLAYLVVVNVASGASSIDGSGGGGYSVYANAMLIMMVPHSVITVSLATALLPRLSDLAADGDLGEVQTRLMSAMRMCLAVIIPLGALITALAFPLTAMIFDHGSASGQTGQLALTLIVLVPGLVAFTVHYLVLRGFYALKDTRTPFYNQIWVSAVMIVGAIVTAIVSPSNQYVTMALAGGYSVAYLVGASAGIYRLQHRIGPLGGADLVQHVVRLVMHSTVAAGLAWLVYRGWTTLGLLDGFPAIIRRLVELIIGGTVGLATFVGLAYAFRIPEVRKAVAMVMGRLRSREAAVATPADPGDLLEDTAEYAVPFETGTLSIFRRPMDPDMTSEFFLDETLPGVPSFFDTSTGAARGGLGVGGAGVGRAGVSAAIAGRPNVHPGQVDVDTQPGHGRPGSNLPPALTVVAGRYRVERLLDDTDGVQCWQAVDDVLRRHVFVQSVDANDPRAPGFVTAARVSSTMEDSRFLRVLDIGTERVSYVVREWTPGHSLATLLGGGAFHPEQAAAIGREVAEAMATAHTQGLAHRHLDPTLVFVTSDGSVKIAGLETEYALRGAAGTPCPPTNPNRPDPAELDAIGAGVILYAGLTARWPDRAQGGLPAAPMIDGRLASPRQVRPGVPTMLDAITDRAIGYAKRHHTTPLLTPSAVAAELSLSFRQGRSVIAEPDGFVEEPPALLDDPDSSPPMSRIEQRRERRKSGRTARLLGVMAATLLLVGVTLVGLQLLLSAFDTVGNERRPSPSESSSSAGKPSADPTPRAIDAVTDYDPPSELGGNGNGEERPSDVGLAIDGDPDTAWSTVSYFDEMERQKPGVGLYVDLGEPVSVQEVRLQLLAADTGLEIRVAPPHAADAPTHLDDWTVVDEVGSAEQNVTLSLDEPVTTRYVLVWFTRLPLYEGNFRGGIAEAEVLG